MNRTVGNLRFIDMPHCSIYDELLVLDTVFSSPLVIITAAVMRSDGFTYLKENCPSLQSELLKTVAGCEEVAAVKVESHGVYGPNFQMVVTPMAEESDKEPSIWTSS